MKLVIDVDEELYRMIRNSTFFIKGGRGSGRTIEYNALKSIYDGTLLPKGHGRLIDADALIDSLGCSDRDIYCKSVIEEDAPTIIEAEAPKKRKGTPLEENDSGYNCEDCISRQAVIDILDDMTKDYAKSNDFEKLPGWWNETEIERRLKNYGKKEEN